MRVLLGASALAVALAMPAVLALPAVLAVPALAQQPSAGNLEKLGNFQQTGTAEMAHIPQTGAKADAIKRSLAKIKLPRGFKISLYAIVPDARHIAVGAVAVIVCGTINLDHQPGVANEEIRNIWADRVLAADLERESAAPNLLP